MLPFKVLLSTVGLLLCLLHEQSSGLTAFPKRSPSPLITEQWCYLKYSGKINKPFSKFWKNDPKTSAKCEVTCNMKYYCLMYFFDEKKKECWTYSSDSQTIVISEFEDYSAYNYYLKHEC